MTTYAASHAVVFSTCHTRTASAPLWTLCSQLYSCTSAASSSVDTSTVALANSTTAQARWTKFACMCIDKSLHALGSGIKRQTNGTASHRSTLPCLQLVIFVFRAGMSISAQHVSLFGSASAGGGIVREGGVHVGGMHTASARVPPQKRRGQLHTAHGSVGKQVTKCAALCAFVLFCRCSSTSIWSRAQALE